MKVLKLLLVAIFSVGLITSCTVRSTEIIDNSISLEKVVSDYDLWYVDYHRTAGTGDIPFMSKAFTLSFLNGRMYANNNIVDVGKTGNGLGIQVGTYRTRRGFLEANHDLDGLYDFDVVVLSNNEIRIDYQNVSYYLIGYQVNNFDYDKLFYENIEYFLQEYMAWERVGAKNGTENPFDDETFLQFTPQDNKTFYSSHDLLGRDIDVIKWDFVGSYVIEDVDGYENLKYLTLNYDNGDTEVFELTVNNDRKISLYHISSETTYVFTGRDFVQYLKKKTKNSVSSNGRKRTIIKRNKVHRKVLK